MMMAFQNGDARYKGGGRRRTATSVLGVHQKCISNLTPFPSRSRK